MILIPDLERSSRSREYNNYTDEQRAAVVKAWLFSKKTHRQIDRDILGIVNWNSRGYQSMGILHYLGLRKEFHNLFHGMTVSESISALKETGNPDFNDIISLLSGNELFPGKQNNAD